MSPTLLVLGHHVFLAPVLRWAREAGLTTVQTGDRARDSRAPAAHEFHSIPADAVEAHAALARRLAREKRLAGVLAVEPLRARLLATLSETVPGLLPPRASLELLNAPTRARAWMLEAGFGPEPGASESGRRFDVFALFRDGAFVPAGIAAQRTLASGDELRLLPGGLDAETERAAYVSVERAARALGFQHGPLQATLFETPRRLALLDLAAGFTDLLSATHLARQAFGRSPLQAWFAHLAGAGGPFDELALTPRATAGWLALAPQRAGLFAGVDGQARARAIPGLTDLWTEEPGRKLESPELPQRPLGYLWAEGEDGEAVEERLSAARAELVLRVATRQRVA